MTHSSLFYPDHPATYKTAHLSFESAGINFDSHKAFIKHRASSEQAKQLQFIHDTSLPGAPVSPGGPLSPGEPWMPAVPWMPWMP